jgi:hypothetical protein
MSMTFNMTNAMEKAIHGVVGDAVKVLSEKYAFDFEEAMGVVGMPTIVSKAKKTNTARTPKKDKCPIVLPYCGVVVDAWCKGIKPHHGTYSQCQNAKIGDTDYCRTCGDHASKLATGKPKNGDIRDRVGSEDDMKVSINGKSKDCKTYETVMEKIKFNGELTWEVVQELVHKFVGADVEIPEVQKTKTPKKRPGRPKSPKPSDESDASDASSVKTESDNSNVGSREEDEDEQEFKDEYSIAEMKALRISKTAKKKKTVPPMMKDNMIKECKVTAKDLAYIGVNVYLNAQDKWVCIGELKGKTVMLNDKIEFQDEDEDEDEMESDMEALPDEE